MLTPKIFQALTIIAAAGKDSDFRLPRVGSTHRPEQPWLEVGKRVLVSSLVNPRVEMESSKWPIRGGTYQEGLLSRRRLVFTRSQVYFQCAGMHCFDSVELPLKAFHTSDRQFRDSTVKCRVFPHGNIARYLEGLCKENQRIFCKASFFRSRRPERHLGCSQAIRDTTSSSAPSVGASNLDRLVIQALRKPRIRLQTACPESPLGNL
jgi:hypothetical protein